MSAAIIDKIRTYTKSKLPEQLEYFPDIEKDLQNSNLDVAEEVYLWVEKNSTIPIPIRYLITRIYFSKVDKIDK